MEPVRSELADLQGTWNEDEEDPFGHGALLDEPQTPMGVGGDAAPDRSSAQTETIEEALGTVPECHQRETRETIELPNASANSPENALQGAHASHVLTRTAHVVLCRICGRHAAVRLGVGLQRPCAGFATGAYPARIARLREQRHPVTGRPLTT